MGKSSSLPSIPLSLSKSAADASGAPPSVLANRRFWSLIIIIVGASFLTVAAWRLALHERGPSAAIPASRHSPFKTHHFSVAATDAPCKLAIAYPHIAFAYNINSHEAQIYAQDGTDGILEYIFDNIGTTNKYYVEFGTQDCTECNTRWLWASQTGWDGLLLDGSGTAPDARKIRNHFLTAENIVELFQKYDVPMEFDFLSVDIDQNDYYVARNIFLAGYRPRVVELEVNNNLNDPFSSYTIKYDPNKMWDGSYRTGMTTLAAQRLLNKFGYHMVVQTTGTWNALFIHRSAMTEYLQTQTGIKYTEDEVAALLPPYKFVYRRPPARYPLKIDHKDLHVDLNEWEVVGENGDIVR